MARELGLKGVLVLARVSRDLKGRRGRTIDPSWANRRLLPRGHDSLSEKGRARLVKTLRQDDPTQEIGAAWGIKEQLRTLLACGSLADAHEEKMRLGYYVMVADMAETWRLWETINAWWTEIEVFLITGVTNARTEAANTSIKQLKRTGRGYRNAEHYKAVSSCAVPPDVRHEHQAQRPTSRRTANSRFSRWGVRLPREAVFPVKSHKLSKNRTFVNVLCDLRVCLSALGACQRRCFIRVATVASAARPSPYGEAVDGVGRGRMTTAARSSTRGRRTFHPRSTVSVHSVSVRSVVHGAPSRKASFWSPPESVTTPRECSTAATICG